MLNEYRKNFGKDINFSNKYVKNKVSNVPSNEQKNSIVKNKCRLSSNSVKGYFNSFSKFKLVCLSESRYTQENTR